MKVEVTARMRERERVDSTEYHWDSVTAATRDASRAHQTAHWLVSQRAVQKVATRECERAPQKVDLKAPRKGPHWAGDLVHMTVGDSAHSTVDSMAYRQADSTVERTARWRERERVDMKADSTEYHWDSVTAATRDALRALQMGESMVVS